MQKSKVLININNLNEIDEYKKIGITNFLFAIKGLSVGYTPFDIDDVPDGSYLLINRVFDTQGINEFKSIIPKLNRFKGILFEDLGVFNLLKDSDIELIWNQAHFVTNYNSINFYLENGCTSCVISNEITKEEINDILDRSIKPLVFTVFARNMIMYSRRSLVSNFNNYAGIDNVNNVNIDEEKTNTHFYLKESVYGTAVFNKNYFNYIEYAKNISEDKVYYYLVLNLDLEPNQIINILDGESYGDDGFLNKKTTYKMSEYDDRKKGE
jgi:hypothetical protein